MPDTETTTTKKRGRAQDDLTAPKAKRGRQKKPQPTHDIPQYMAQPSQGSEDDVAGEAESEESEGPGPGAKRTRGPGKKGTTANADPKTTLIETRMYQIKSDHQFRKRLFDHMTRNQEWHIRMYSEHPKEYLNNQIAQWVEDPVQILTLGLGDVTRAEERLVALLEEPQIMPGIGNLSGAVTADRNAGDSSNSKAGPSKPKAGPSKPKAGASTLTAQDPDATMVGEANVSEVQAHQVHRQAR